MCVRLSDMFINHQTPPSVLYSPLPCWNSCFCANLSEESLLSQSLQRLSEPGQISQWSIRLLIWGFRVQSVLTESALRHYPSSHLTFTLCLHFFATLSNWKHMKMFVIQILFVIHSICMFFLQPSYPHQTALPSSTSIRQLFEKHCSGVSFIYLPTRAGATYFNLLYEALFLQTTTGIHLVIISNMFVHCQYILSFHSYVWEEVGRSMPFKLYISFITFLS